MRKTPGKAAEDRQESDAVRFFEEMDRMRKVWRNFKPEHGFTKNNLGLLALIDRLEKEGHTQLSVSELAAQIHHSSPAVSQKVTTLEQHGYLERVGDPADRRVCYVRLTESGRQATRENFELFMNRVDGALGELGQEQVETLLRLMHELTDALSRQCKPGQSEQMGEKTLC